MRRAELANRLISAANDSERKNLLAENRPLADIRLAREIRKTCYAVWTVEPVKAQRAALAMRTLLDLTASDEMRAIACWVAGIADITKAKFESAIKNLESAAAVFDRIKRLHDSAQTQVAKLLALAMLGRYDEAIRTGKKALKIFVSEGDQLAAGKIEMNLSNIVSRRSQHHEAEKYCLSARRRFIKASEDSWKAMAENGLANTYAEINDFEKAEKYFRMALNTARSEKMLVTEAEIEASFGNLEFSRGRYAEALYLLEQSRQKYDTLEMPHQSAIADLEIADIYSELNLRDEASEIYERIIGTFHSLKLKAEEARSRLNYGRTLTLIDKDGANGELKAALNLFLAEKNLAGEAASLFSLSELAIGQRNFTDAGLYLKQAANASRHSESPRQQVRLALLNGELYRATGKLEKAEKYFSDALALARKYRYLDAVQFALNSLGKISLSQGEVKKAETFFRKAIGTIEDLRAPIATDEIGMAFFASKLEPYQNLAQVLIGQNKLSEAFKVIESGRARSLLDAASEATKRSSPFSQKLNTELQEIRAELNFTYKRSDSAEADEAQRLTGRIVYLEKRLADTLRKIDNLRLSGRSKTHAAFEVNSLQTQLDESSTLVEFVELNGKISAFIVTTRSIRFVRDLTTSGKVRESLEKLHFQFGALRYGGAQLEKFAGILKMRADKYLQELYDQLLSPIADQLYGKRLIIVPVGNLNYVPFHALHDGEKYLIEKSETVYAPSAGVWTSLHERPKRKLKNSLLIGYADEKIPLVENEVREIGQIVPAPTVLIAGKATFSAFIGNAPKFDLIHLACHGRFRTDNPMFSSLHLADGWITVRDICSQRLRAKLVTLSACETGLSEIFAGEEILGLARGFLTAGADSLVVSLWAVNDAATGRLMRGFYDNLQREGSISASLRQAQLDLVKRGEHPFYWSPFILIGK